MGWKELIPEAVGTAGIVQVFVGWNYHAQSYECIKKLESMAGDPAPRIPNLAESVAKAAEYYHIAGNGLLIGGMMTMAVAFALTWYRHGCYRKGVEPFKGEDQ